MLSSQSESQVVPARDQFLDVLRGVAILLVVLGHQFQGMSPDFDNLLWFRLIYSFHMPLFMFVGGMAAAMPLRSGFDISMPWWRYLRVAGVEINSKATRLLLPFFAWGIVMYFLRENYAAMPPLEYALLLLKNPDNGLWFLPALFFCQVFFIFGKFLWCVLQNFAAPKLKFFIFSIVLFVSYKALLAMPDLFALYLSKSYYLYFLMGVLWVVARVRRLPGVLHELPFLIFLILFPFWHRTLPSEEISRAWGSLHIPNPQLLLKVLVAVSAIYIVLQILNRMDFLKYSYLNNLFAFLGKKSLDVYAIHFFFLGYFSHIFGTIFAIAASLLIGAIMKESLFLGWIFFGEKRNLIY